MVASEHPLRVGLPSITITTDDPPLASFHFHHHMKAKAGKGRTITSARLALPHHLSEALHDDHLVVDALVGAA